MTPQLVDLNADGYQDMVMGTFEGTVFLVEGTREGFKAPQHILDKNNEIVRISMYWDLEEETYLYVDRSAAGENYVKEHHLTSSWAVDWDNDGDLDLLLGAYEGALYLCMNEGTSSEPLFSDKNLQVKADGKNLTLAGGLATPITCDWNGDGLFDILCGGSKGCVFYYENVGEKGKPVFAAATKLIDELATTPDPNGYMNAVPAIDGQPACPGTGYHICAADYDSDGDLDLVIGGQSWVQAVKKSLTSEDLAKLASIKEEQEVLQSRLQEFFKDATEKEEFDKLAESTEYLELSKQLRALYQEMQELEPSPQVANHVWLFRNKGKGTVETSTNSSRESGDELKNGDASELFSVSAGSANNKLTLTASFDVADAVPGDEVKLNVQLNVPNGFHIYGASSETVPTEFAITDPGLLIPGESSGVPAGTIHLDSGKQVFWLEGKIVLTQSFTVPEGFDGETIEGQVKYMMCNEKGCQPPVTRKFEATLKSK